MSITLLVVAETLSQRKMRKMRETFLEFQLILNSGIAAAIGLFAIKIGFISCSIVDAPFGLPLFINATISYGWHGAIVQLVILIVGTLTYIPFVLMSNRMAEKEAQKEQ